MSESHIQATKALVDFLKQDFDTLEVAQTIHNMANLLDERDVLLTAARESLRLVEHENERLREALSTYADETNWVWIDTDDHPDSHVWHEDFCKPWKQAREALKGGAT